MGLSAEGKENATFTQQVKCLYNKQFGTIDSSEERNINSITTMRSAADSLYTEFGELVQAHRNRLGGMTQAELGRCVGLSRTSVTNIECGRHHVSLDQLFLIAEALHIPPEALLPSVAHASGSSRMADLLPPDLETELVQWADGLLVNSGQ